MRDRKTIQRLTHFRKISLTGIGKIIDTLQAGLSLLLTDHTIVLRRFILSHWAYDSVFYHIYPLGFCGAPPENDFCSPANHRLELIYRLAGAFTEFRCECPVPGAVI